MAQTADKKIYSTPRLVLIGSLREITQGGRTGNHLDQTFPAGTPFTQLLLS